MAKVLDINKMGNFGFLYGRKEFLLFELAKLAESNIYTNTRLSGIYIRQLAESFLGGIAEKVNIISEEMECDLGHYIVYLSNAVKERKLNDIAESARLRKMFLYVDDDKNFQKVSEEIRLNVIEDLNNKIQKNIENHKDIKRLRKTIEILENKSKIERWDYIRRIGNASSHSAILRKNLCWIEPEYMINALRCIHEIMCEYYEISVEKYSENKISYASGRVYFVEDNAVEYEGNDILPGYTENICVNAVTSDDVCQWRKNKYSIVRRFPIKENMDEFLRHSQEAYLILQEKCMTDGLAVYNVLADDNVTNKYYITSYEFNSKPSDISIDALDQLGVYKSLKNLREFFVQVANILKEMSEAEVYHRNLTHRSLKICRVGRKRFKVFIVDLELVKLIEGKTIWGQAMEAQKPQYLKYYGNLQQYIGEDMNINSDQEYYEYEVMRRFGCIGANILCPIHLDKNKEFLSSANYDDIISNKNILVSKVFKNGELNDWARLFTDLQNKVISDWNTIIQKLKGDD